MTEHFALHVTVNGRTHDLLVEPRTLLVDLLRDQLQLPGTHIGCEQGVCGACTVLVDGQVTRSCLMFAPQVDGAQIETVESLGSPDGTLHPVQQAFADNHGLQCGFCTPGMLMTTCALLRRDPEPDDASAKESLAGNLCRCTGYQHILESVHAAARGLGEASPTSETHQHEGATT